MPGRSYGKGCADWDAETSYDYETQWGCCGEGGAPVVADAETTIYLADPGSTLDSCDVKVALSWPGPGVANPEPTKAPVTSKPTPAPKPVPAPAGPPSAGSCYPTPTTVTCDVAEADCDAYWYAPGYVGGSGCCHCDSLECDHSQETTPFEECSYYPGLPETGEEEPAPAPAPAPDSGVSSAGSCYDITTHVVTCDVAEAECDMYYEPGYVGGSGCCHCDSVECDHSKETSEEACSYYAMPEPEPEVPAPAPEPADEGDHVSDFHDEHHGEHHGDHDGHHHGGDEGDHVDESDPPVVPEVDGAAARLAAAGALAAAALIALA